MARHYGPSTNLNPLEIIRGRLTESRYTVLRQGDIVTITDMGDPYMQIDLKGRVVTPHTSEAHNGLADFMDRCRRNGLDLDSPFDNH